MMSRIEKLLDNCSSYGGLLSSADRNLIMKYIEEPTEKLWIGIREIVINPNRGLGISVEDAICYCLTVEQARENKLSSVLLLGFTKGELPNPFLVARAIKVMTKKTKRRTAGKRKVNEKNSSRFSDSVIELRKWTKT